MTTRVFVAIVAVLTFFVLCGTAFEADAARFGGGRSFGGSSSFSKPFSSQRLPQSGVTRSPSATQQQPGAAAAAPAAARPGFGMMGGMLGGLLAGTLLGSLLSGHGFAGGGMLDILLIGLGLYLLFKFLGRRRASQQADTHISGVRMPMPDQEPRDTGTHYKAEQTQNAAWSNLGGNTETTTAPSANVPAGFDQEDFLRGAKMLYQRMNESWDKRDLNDIAEFATQPFMAEIRAQADEFPTPETTELMLVEASLVSVVKEAGRETATVFFNVLLREDPRQSTSTQVREVWHFVRAADTNETWRLDGIQQVEN